MIFTYATLLEFLHIGHSMSEIEYIIGGKATNAYH